MTHGLRIPLSDNYISRQDEVSESLSFSVAEAEEALTAIVTKLLTWFFRSFDFFEPPRDAHRARAGEATRAEVAESGLLPRPLPRSPDLRARLRRQRAS